MWRMVSGIVLYYDKIHNDEEYPSLFIQPKAWLLINSICHMLPLLTHVDAYFCHVVFREEWGNPNEEKYFDYMMEYSPMNTVKAGAKYPSCLLTGGLHDPRVQFWEPSKFAAELRHSMDNDASGPVCLKIDMTAGHFSASDRYKYLKELSFDYAFLLDQLGLSEVEPTK